MDGPAAIPFGADTNELKQFGVKKQLRILIIEDAVVDVELMNHELRKGGLTFRARRVETKEAFVHALEQDPPDLILSDHGLPSFDGFAALALAHQKCPDVPFIFVTGSMGEEVAIQTFESGATDYVLKKNLAKRYGLEEDEYYIHLQREWARSLRRPAPLALILIDCDFFKHYNDAYGHQRGDECLQQVARALAHGLHRPGDLLARYGGEEFVAILPETDFEGASVVAETLRTAVEALGIKHASSCVRDRVTVSLGVAASVPRRDSSPNQLVAAADAALYWAKREGRNCVRAAADRNP